MSIQNGWSEEIILVSPKEIIFVLSVMVFMFILLLVVSLT